MASWIARLATVAVVALSTLAGIFYFFIMPELRRPSLAEMRAFQISKLTDQQLREMHTKAEAEAEALRIQTARDKQTTSASLNAKIAECEANMNDVAYKARNPNGCNRLPLLLLDGSPAYRTKSATDVLEEMILGECRFADSIREARKLGCLPP